MLFKKVLGLFFVFTALQSCLSAAKQTRSLFNEIGDLQGRVGPLDVPFIKQEVAQCGPATLAMVLNYHGNPVVLDIVAEKVFKKKYQGTLPADLIWAARTEKMLAFQIKGLKALLRELDSGNPVIVFENLGLKIFPQWHFAVVVGYDLLSKTLILHSGPKPFKIEKMAEFELSWSLADYWGLVVLPPGKISSTGTEVEHVAAVVALENLGYTEAAEKGYRGILDRWPHSYVSLLGLGQLAFQKNQLILSNKYLQKAVEINPGSEVARQNLETVLKIIAQQ